MTSFRARMCLFGVPKPNFTFLPKRKFLAHFWRDVLLILLSVMDWTGLNDAFLIIITKDWKPETATTCFLHFCLSCADACLITCYIPFFRRHLTHHKDTICENERIYCNYLIIPHTSQTKISSHKCCIKTHTRFGQSSLPIQ